MNPAVVASAGPEVGETIAFWLFAILVLMGAGFTMTRRNPVSAVMSLVGTFCGLAVLYAMLSAHFLAILQVLVYAGAIMVLFIFVVMIVNREETTPISLRGWGTRVLGIVAGLYLFVFFMRLVWERAPYTKVKQDLDPTFGTVASIGDILFREFLFPFEAISLLLLVAIVGSVVVSRSAKQEKIAMDAEAHRKEIRSHSGEGGPGGSHDESHAGGGGHH